MGCGQGAVIGMDPAVLPNPHRGLESFGENDSRHFYGRDAVPSAWCGRCANARWSRGRGILAGLGGRGGAGLFDLDLDRENMRERLCAISSRDFTAAELDTPPAGADSTPPCAR